jgi:hypothetical protein
MTQRLRYQVPLRRHHARASRTPKGAVRVRRAWELPGAGLLPDLGLP